MSSQENSDAANDGSGGNSENNEDGDFRNPVEGPAMLAIGIVGILCNILVLVVLRRKHELKLSPDYRFLLRLQSWFDLLYLITSTPVTAIPYVFPQFHSYALVLPWIFPFVQICMTASIYTTIALAFERYMSIRETLSSQRRFPCRGVAAAILLFAVGINAPRFFELSAVREEKTTVVEVNNTGQIHKDFALRTVVVFSVKPTAEIYTVGYFLGYNMVGSFLISLFVPVSCLSVLNTLIWRRLQSIWQNRTRLGVKEKRNTRAALSLVFVVILFFICHSMKLVVSGYQVRNIRVSTSARV